MISDRYHQYAADCVRLAESETSTVAKTVILNMALCWVRLAQQKQEIEAPLAPDAEPLALRPAAVLESAVSSEH